MVALHGTEMYSKRNERKSVVAEKFIRTLKTKSTGMWLWYQKMYKVDNLDEIVQKYSKIYHRTIKMKPLMGTYID